MGGNKAATFNNDTVGILVPDNTFEVIATNERSKKLCSLDDTKVSRVNETSVVGLKDTIANGISRSISSKGVGQSGSLDKLDISKNKSMNIDLPSKGIKDAIGSTASRRLSQAPSQFKTVAKPKMP